MVDCFNTCGKSGIIYKPGELATTNGIDNEEIKCECKKNGEWKCDLGPLIILTPPTPSFVTKNPIDYEPPVTEVNQFTEPVTEPEKPVTEPVNYDSDYPNEYDYGTENDISGYEEYESPTGPKEFQPKPREYFDNKKMHTDSITPSMSVDKKLVEKPYIDTNFPKLQGNQQMSNTGEKRPNSRAEQNLFEPDRIRQNILESNPELQSPLGDLNEPNDLDKNRANGAFSGQQISQSFNQPTQNKEQTFSNFNPFDSRKSDVQQPFSNQRGYQMQAKPDYKDVNPNHPNNPEITNPYQPNTNAYQPDSVPYQPTKDTYQPNTFPQNLVPNQPDTEINQANPYQPLTSSWGAEFSPSLFVVRR